MNIKPKILIIDDEATILFILEKALSSEGYEVKCASNGDEAAKLASCHQFNLAMIDLVMPDMDGFQIIAELHEKQPEISIIAMSGGWNGVSGSYLRMAGKIGACRTLAKPFSKIALLEAVHGEIGKCEQLSA